MRSYVGMSFHIIDLGSASNFLLVKIRLVRSSLLTKRICTDQSVCNVSVGLKGNAPVRAVGEKLDVFDNIPRGF